MSPRVFHRDADPTGDGARNREESWAPPPPLPPKRFRIEPEGAGVRLIVTDRDRLTTDGPLSGAIAYDIHWAEDVDTSTTTGLEAGYARSEIVKTIARIYEEDHEIKEFLADPKYAHGFFYCTGRSADGQRSDPTFPARHITGRRKGTGRITVTNGSANVTGTGTKFLFEANAGDYLEVDTSRVRIKEITSNTGLVLEAVWPGVTRTDWPDFWFYTEEGLASLSVPPDVEHFLVSESGEIHNDVVFSALSWTCRAPAPKGSFAGIQLYIDDGLGAKQQLSPHWHNGIAGSGMSGKHVIPVGRVPMTGTITSIVGSTVTGSGTKFDVELKEGDLLEILGHKQEVSAIAGSTLLVLSSSWTGPLPNADKAVAIRKVTVYAVSLSRSGVRRADIKESPAAEVVLDGELSAPLAPASLTLTPFDNGVRIEFPAVKDDSIKTYRVFRNKESSSPITDYFASDRRNVTNVKMLVELSADRSRQSAGNLYQYEDTDFAVADKEEQLEWRWYVDSVNVRGEISSNYVTETSVCRLAKPNDTDPFIPSRSGAKNFLYNAVLSGTNAGSVDRADTVQDQWQGDTTTPATPDLTAAADAFTNGAGGVPSTPASATYFGYSRWHSSVTAGSRATHTNGDEIAFTAPGAGQTSYVYQDIGGWTNSAYYRRNIKKGGIFTLQFKAKKSGTIAGNFDFYLEQYNVTAGPTVTLAATAAKRYRDSADALQWTAFSSAGKGVIYDADISSSVWTLFFATFLLDHTAECDFLRVNFAWNDGTANTIWIKEPMLSMGEELFAWTPDLHVRPIFTVGTNFVPFDIGDGGGGRGFTPEI